MTFFSYLILIFFYLYLFLNLIYFTFPLSVDIKKNLFLNLRKGKGEIKKRGK